MSVSVAPFFSGNISDRVKLEGLPRLEHFKPSRDAHLDLLQAFPSNLELVLIFDKLDFFDTFGVLNSPVETEPIFELSLEKLIFDCFQRRHVPTPTH